MPLMFTHDVWSAIFYFVLLFHRSSYSYSVLQNKNLVYKESIESRLIFSGIKTGFSRVYILTEIDVTESDVN